ncbi:MAG: hypothetical protein JRJ42_06610 [Deltaproteobacteria bacterium]|nr:hypothetical protein [Deltaproteobacteria bacterium]MBW2019810.1 hypothetical protein [Deltaproteobacteria bacterium]MBW2074615.1 hypothetical protein [Deltaproteobacteria bacterium]
MKKTQRKTCHVAFVMMLTLVFSCFAGCEKAEEISFVSRKEEAKKVDGTLKKILIVHSYHQGLGWNEDTERGVVEGLKMSGYVLDKDYQMKKFYMDTKITYVTPQQIKERADKAIKLIEEFKPDLVIVNDDNALKYVAVTYAMENPQRKLPFLFTGINCDPTIYEPVESLENPGHYITGALERFPYYQSFSLARKIFPDKKRVFLMGDSSPSADFIVQAFKKRYLGTVKDSPLEVVAVVQVKTFKEWKEKIKEYQDKADFLGIITYYQLLDEHDRFVHAWEVLSWTINHNRLPELGFLLFHSEDGFWMSVGVSPLKTGRYVGKIAGDILDGKDPGAIPVVDPRCVDIAFNLERSNMLGIKIPVDILNMATVTYKEIKRPRF